MRLSCVKAIQQLYRDAEFVAQLETFTKRFYARIVQMASSDSDGDVQMAAIALTTEMSRYALPTYT